MAIVYKAENLLNGKTYIGVTSRTLEYRKYVHLWFAKNDGKMIISRAIRKHGPEAFVFRVIEEHDDIDDAYEAEKKYIALLKPQYNVARGGKGGAQGTTWSEERRQKTRSSLKKAWTDERRRRASEAQKGVKKSAEWYAKLVASLRPDKVWKPVVCLDDGKWFASVKAAAEYYGIGKRRISTICKGYEIAAKGKHFVYSDRALSEEERYAELEKRNRRRSGFRDRVRKARCRPVTCLNDKKVYESGVAAARAYGISNSRVVQLCKVGGETESGLRFMYTDASAPPIKRTRTDEEIQRAQSLRDAALERAWKGRQKSVICLNDGKRFDSISHAARAYSIGVALVSAAIHRKGKTFGLSFRFENDQ